MRIGIVLVAVGGVVVVVVVVRLVRLQRHTSPTHCYGRAMSTLISEKKELAKVRPPKQQRNWLVRYLLAPIRTGLRWIRSYLRYRLRPKHKLVALDADQGEGIDELRAGANGSTCLAITGDWADGSPNSRAVATAIERVGADYTCHLGDIYSVGATHEIERKFLGHDGGIAWPLGRLRRMRCPGQSRIQLRRPRLLRRRPSPAPRAPNTKPAASMIPQPATYFCLRNDHWNVIGLDTGYHAVKWAGLEGLVLLLNHLPILKDTRWAQSLTTELPDEILDWLRVILADDSRAIVVLTHHQDLTTLDPRGPHPKPREQMSQSLRSIAGSCGSPVTGTVSRSTTRTSTTARSEPDRPLADRRSRGHH